MGVSRGIVGAVVAAVCTACSGGGTTADPSMPLVKLEARPQVEAILQNMRERYRSARTYRDEGTYRSVSRGPNGNVVATASARVRTRWAAPNRLLFEFHEDASRFDPGGIIAVWTPHAGVTKSWSVDEETVEPSLDAALGTLQGVSHRTTGLVPRWLLEGGCKCALPYELRGTTKCGRATCFELAGATGPDRRVTLFVDAKNHALRKVVWNSRFSLEPIPAEVLDRVPAERRSAAQAKLEAERSVEDEDTLELEPTFDGPEEATSFDFEPPASRKH